MPEIRGIIWLEKFVVKIWKKHRVSVQEVEEVFGDKPRFWFLQKGKVKYEDIYLALGQTESGRYLSVVFVHKKSKDALILSARDMARKERRQYGKK